MTKETFIYGYAPLSVIINKVNVIIERTTQEEREGCELLEPVGQGVVLYNRSDVLARALQERSNDVLRETCNVAAGEGRFDLLNEIFNNVYDREDKEHIFRCADYSATIHGKLEVLKWLGDTKGVLPPLYNEWCAIIAARHGQLHILKWLREEQGLELDGELYQQASDQLHVMKWLREQEIPWDEWTFNFATQGGNLDILQWLHDEGCPWPNSNWHCLPEDNVKPEILNWLRANGYGDRFF
eukprot:CAMPEP_0178954912 /NCGR_PEP_ID=MMETSP0789-20121207/9285_1 /TAXON_ID=3005 /ORGANISM="Rhizosolenia setigera, Strain CCMP 1694" /LENGTH=240 /DNA_ID=CAMNT_0020636429 /DNA_START=258 /DNA_END=980 /DNA_ORIENTATION=-